MRWHLECSPMRSVALTVACWASIGGSFPNMTCAGPIVPEATTPTNSDAFDLRGTPALWFRIEPGDNAQITFKLRQRHLHEAAFEPWLDWSDTLEQVIHPRVIRSGDQAIACISGRLRGRASGRRLESRSIWCWRLSIREPKQVSEPVELANDTIMDYLLLPDGVGGGVIWYRTGSPGIGDAPIDAVAFDHGLAVVAEARVDHGLATAATELANRRAGFDVVGRDGGFLVAWAEQRVDLLVGTRDDFTCLQAFDKNIKASDPAYCFGNPVGPSVEIGENGRSVFRWTKDDCVEFALAPGKAPKWIRDASPNVLKLNSRRERRPADCRPWQAN